MAAEMPNPNLPTITAWTSRISELIGDDPEVISRTVLVGHSVGCQAVLRYLEGLPKNVHVQGVLCVAGWFSVDEPWDAIRPWIDTPIDFDHVRAAANKTAVLLSDNDPFTSDWQANRKLWEQRLDADVSILPGARHIKDKQRDEILQAVLNLAQ